MNEFEYSCEDSSIVIKPDGEHELDPHVYEDIEMYVNATVIISRCKYCGKITISWIRQENTEQVNIYE